MSSLFYLYGAWSEQSSVIQAEYPSIGASSHRKPKIANDAIACSATASNQKGKVVTTQMSSLLNLPTLRPQHGPPLPLDRQLCRLHQPQIFHAIPLLYHPDPHLLHGGRNPSPRRTSHRTFQQHRHPLSPLCPQSSSSHLQNRLLCSNYSLL